MTNSVFARRRASQVLAGGVVITIGTLWPPFSHQQEATAKAPAAHNRNHAAHNRNHAAHNRNHAAHNRNHAAHNRNHAARNSNDAVIIRVDAVPNRNDAVPNQMNAVLNQVDTVPNQVDTVPNQMNAVLNQMNAVLNSNEDARVSLQLKNVPLVQMLRLLGAQSGVRFHYATVPDVAATISLEAAPLRPALRDVLASLGFGLQDENRTEPAARDQNADLTALWLVRAAPVSDSTPAPNPNTGNAARVPTAFSTLLPPSRGAATWQQWTGTQAPSSRWMQPLAPVGGEFSGTVGRGTTAAPSGVPGIAPVGVRVQWRGDHRLREETDWHEARLSFESNLTHPGAHLLWRETARNNAVNTASNPQAAPFLRWPLQLRRMPKQLQLWIETDRAATLYVNGARLLRWTGARRLDLSETLQSGANMLAIVWDAPAKDGQSAARNEWPNLNYEWLAAD